MGLWKRETNMDADYFRQLAMADPDTWTSDDFLDAANLIERLGGNRETSTINSIKELKARKAAALEEYHRFARECDAQIKAIRAKRGTVLKPIPWTADDAMWADPGRNALPDTYR